MHHHVENWMLALFAFINSIGSSWINQHSQVFSLSCPPASAHIVCTTIKGLTEHQFLSVWLVSLAYTLHLASTHTQFDLLVRVLIIIQICVVGYSMYLYLFVGCIFSPLERRFCLVRKWTRFPFVLVWFGWCLSFRLRILKCERFFSYSTQNFSPYWFSCMLNEKAHMRAKKWSCRKINEFLPKQKNTPNENP